MLFLNHTYQKLFVIGLSKKNEEKEKKKNWKETEWKGCLREFKSCTP